MISGAVTLGEITGKIPMPEITYDRCGRHGRRLDQADLDRWQALDRLAVAQERIAALLTDQRPAPRRWWRR